MVNPVPSSWSRDQVSRVAEAVQALVRRARELGDPIRAPKGYPHLGLAVIDSVFSLRAQYDRHVVPVLDRYCDGVVALRPEDARFDERVPEHSAQSVRDRLTGMTTAELGELFGNRQVAPGTSIPKARVVLDVAEALVESGAPTRSDFAARVFDGRVERSVRSVPGIGPAAWRYLQVLARVERVKPDTMIVGWMREHGVAPRGLGPEALAAMLEAAIAHLVGLDSSLSVRAVDHLIWRVQSGRLPLEN